MTMFSMAGKTPDRTLSLIYANGDTATIPESHDRFDELLGLVFAGADDEEVGALVDVMLAVSKHMEQLSERVSIRGRNVLFDGDQLRGELAEVIFDLFESGNPESLRPIVNFLEKAATNPSNRSVDDLYRWVTNGDLIIHEDGDVLAYKGVQLLNGERFSITEGTAFVDGEEITGYIPNPDGAVVSMARSDVDDNIHEACSTGLHAGTYSYAKKFLGWHRGEGVMLLIKFNPRDVVSVPTDDLDQKLRVCRYVVQGVVDGRRDSHVFREEVPAPEEARAPLFEVVGFGYVDFSEEGLEDYEEDLELGGPTDRSHEEALASDEALEALRQKLRGEDLEYQSSAPSEAEVESASEVVIRDSKGRFTKESAVKAVRNSKGQFTKQS